jgi:parallel beta-helix repeat protein
MKSGDFLRKGAVCLASGLISVLLLYACGGGGGSSRVSAGSQVGPLDPTPTPIVVPQGSGSSLPTFIKNAPAGSTIVVPTGLYVALKLGGADGIPVNDSITLQADVTGAVDGDTPGDAVIDAALGDGATAAITVTGVTHLTLDGFKLVHGTDAGIVVINSPQTTIRNSTMTQNNGDGVVVQQSDDAVVFNNLIWNNAGAGIRTLGTHDSPLRDLRVVNNTVYQNADTGIVIGVFALRPVIENNIVRANTPFGIQVDVDPSIQGYKEDFNLSTDLYDGVLAGMHDVIPLGNFTADPLFIFPLGGDFHVEPVNNPTIGAGDPAISSPAPGNTAIVSPTLVDLLRERTTTGIGTDTAALDLGYHYVLPTPLPTRGSKTPKPTAKPGGSTPTRTPTPPLTHPTKTPTH